MSDETLSTQLARYKAIEEAPEHKSHVVLGCRVDTWKDEETGSYIACVPESLTQGRTEEEALKSVESIMRMHIRWTTENFPEPRR